MEVTIDPPSKERPRHNRRRDEEHLGYVCAETGSSTLRPNNDRDGRILTGKHRRQKSPQGPGHEHLICRRDDLTEGPPAMAERPLTLYLVRVDVVYKLKRIDTGDKEALLCFVGQALKGKHVGPLPDAGATQLPSEANLLPEFTKGCLLWGLARLETASRRHPYRLHASPFGAAVKEKDSVEGIK
jgi:hypothetical protein